MDIDAGRQAFLDERARDRVPEIADGDGGQDENDISHKSLYFLLRVVVLFVRVEIDKKRSTQKRPIGSSTRSPRTRWIIQAIIVFLVATVVASALVGDQGLLATLRARQQYNELSQTIARQRTENARLREEARRLREDPAAIEEIARRELGLIRPGEKLFILKDLPPTSKQP